MVRWEIRFAGFGGQGVISAGYLLARAVSIQGGMNALMTQSYGPEARGGECRADVIISDEPIDYPKVVDLDYLIAMSGDAFQGYCNSVRPEGVIFYVEGLVSPPCDYSGPRTICVPALRVADELGSRLTVNMVMLGALVEYSGLVDLGQLGEVVRERFPRHAAVNLKALEKGREVIMNLRVAV